LKKTIEDNSTRAVHDPQRRGELTETNDTLFAQLEKIENAVEKLKTALEKESPKKAKKEAKSEKEDDKETVSESINYDNLTKYSAADLKSLLDIKNKELKKLKSGSNIPPYIQGQIKKLGAEIGKIERELNSKKDVNEGAINSDYKYIYKKIVQKYPDLVGGTHNWNLIKSFVDDEIDNIEITDTQDILNKFEEYRKKKFKGVLNKTLGREKNKEDINEGDPNAVYYLVKSASTGKYLVRMASKHASQTITGNQKFKSESEAQKEADKRNKEEKKEDLKESLKDSTNEFEGLTYDIFYKAPKGYIAIGKGEAKSVINPQFFNTSDEAKEHAELEISGYLGY
jgi:hypothetical protein